MSPDSLPTILSSTSPSDNKEVEQLLALKIDGNNESRSYVAKIFERMGARVLKATSYSVGQEIARKN